MSALPTVSLSVLDSLLARARVDVDAAHEAAIFLNVAFWNEEEAETLSYTDLDEAIEALLDACYPRTPESLEVVGYRRMVLHDSFMDPDWILESLYEHLDEDYNAGDDASEPTQAVVEAARVFLAVVRREYVPWGCEQAVKVTLDAADIRRKCAEFWPLQKATVIGQ